MTASPLQRWIGLSLELGKARLSALVVVTTLAGYLMAARPLPGWGHLAATLLGTTLCAFGANGFNQVLERDRDALMVRTRERPLPAGRVGVRAAALWSGAVVALGTGLLLALVNATAAALALGTVVLYVLVYTPLKPRSTLNTLAGAICGAIPPLIGWSAVTGGVQSGGWWLALLLFVWQVPHFLSLAWLYRDDYRRAGFKMLPLQDPRGDRTFRFLMLYAWVLLPLGLLATFMGLTGAVFAVGSLLLGGAWLWLGVRCYRDRSSLNARRVFLGSVVYLPLVLGLMVADRAPPREEPAAAVVEVAPPTGSA
ncbi:MAG: protoheme IX farnesyltransferase [bacterium]|nr:protoheme IX farnesyltransferase [bacterium]